MRRLWLARRRRSLRDSRNEILALRISKTRHGVNRMQIFRTTANLPPIIVLHGLPGIGKTTLAAEFSLSSVRADRGRLPERIGDQHLWAARKLRRRNRRHANISATQPHEYKTVVLDSLDKLEPLSLSGGLRPSRLRSASKAPASAKAGCRRINGGSTSCARCEWLRRTRGMTIVLHRALRDRHRQ